MGTKRNSAASPAKTNTERVAFWALAGFLVSGMLLHGLLLEREFLTASTVCALLLLLVAMSDRLRLRQPALIGALAACMVGYGIPVFYAVAPAHALQEALKSIIPVSVAVLGWAITATAYRKLIQVMVMSAALTTILGLALGLFYEGRLAGFMDYANGLGILLLVCSVLGFPLYMAGKQTFYLPAAYTFALGIGLTQSRTVFALGVLGAFVSLLASRRGDRLAWGNYASVSLMGVAGAACYGNSLWLFALTILFAGGFVWGLSRMATRRLPLAAVGMGALAAIFAALVLWGGSIFRWLSLSSNLTDLRTRLVYYEDGLDMIRDSIWTGYGGGAWAELQYRYQSADYYIAYLHNHLLQTWLDAGIVGVGTFLAVTVLVVANGIRSVRRSKEGLHSFEVARLAACIALWLQSLLDFTFSSPYLFALFIFLGIQTEDGDNLVKRDAGLRAGWAKAPIAACCIMLALLAGSTLLAQTYYDRAIRAASQERLADAVSYLERSMAFGIYDDAAHDRKARLYYEGYMERRDRAYLTIADAEIDAALAGNPEHVWYRKLRSDIDWELGERAAALSELERLVRQNPFMASWREELNKKRSETS
ncbi:O-antigen ligase family protein [Paenibacillus aurantiacus]|uniref:O-antigen ligase family protein n=1 Tax=Paenibacillus aurantiacus TaxID=1936118 RepID=A0ABV5KM32_9BACL